MSFRTKKILVAFMVVIAFLSFLLKLILIFYILDMSPKTPMIATGEVYPFNYGGSIFYVTKNQNFLQDVLWVIFIVLGLSAGILNYRWNVFPSTFDNLPKDDRNWKP